VKIQTQIQKMKREQTFQLRNVEFTTPTEIQQDPVEKIQQLGSESNVLLQKKQRIQKKRVNFFE